VGVVAGDSSGIAAAGCFASAVELLAIAGVCLSVCLSVASCSSDRQNADPQEKTGWRFTILVPGGRFVC
jgi:hypothetical protein